MSPYRLSCQSPPDPEPTDPVDPPRDKLVLSVTVLVFVASNWLWLLTKAALEGQ